MTLDELGAGGRLAWDPAAAKSDRAAFDAAELEIIKQSIEDLREPGGESPSEWSHDESVGWDIAGEDGVAIDYSSALISPRPIPQKDLEKAAKLAVERGWARAS